MVLPVSLQPSVNRQTGDEMMRGSSRETHAFAKVLACSLALLLALALAVVPTAALAEDESGQAADSSGETSTQPDESQADELPSDDSSSQEMSSADDEAVVSTADVTLTAQSGPGAPSKSNPHFYSTQNPFYPTYAPGGSGLGSNSLGNCTWYAFGRAFDYLGSRPNLCTGNADKWYDYNKNHNYYPYGSTPRVGAVACFSNQHVAVVEAVDSTGVWLSESGAPSKSHPNGFLYDYRKLGSWGSADATLQGYIYIVPNSTPTNQDPQGYLDVIDGGAGTIRVAGWAFDPDDTGNPIWVHVYANNQYVGRALANQYRPDVDNVTHSGQYHGFDVTLPTTITGSAHVTVYAINTPSTPGNPTIGQKDITIAPCDHSWQDYYEVTDVTHTKGSRCSKCGLTQNITTGIPHTFVQQGGKFVCSDCGAEETSYAVTEVPSGQYVICAAGNNGLCLDVDGASLANGANVMLGDSNGGKNQLFSIRKAGTDGAVRIQAVHSGMYLDVIGSGVASGTNVVQGASLIDNELWYPELTDDGHYAFRSKVNNLYLDITGATLANRTNIEVWMGNGSVAQKFDLVRKQDTITRLSGDTALDTMSAIVSAGFTSTGGTAVLCTSGGYWDALTAAGVAGFSSAPVLLTDGSSLSPQTIDCLTRLKPATVVVCGGPGAVSETAASQAAAAAGGARVVRLWGDRATDTATDAYLSGASKLGCTWSDTAIIATDDGYWDALAAAPYAYWAHCPIFLADGHDRLTDATISAMKTGGITKAIIVGGEMAVSSDVERQLGSAGITVDRRLWGDNAVQTSAAIASFEMTQGMSANGMAVATTNGYWDALSGAALCGSRGSVLVLANDSDRRAIDQIAGANVAGITSAYVFGGEMAVSASTYDYLATTLG